MLLVTSRLVVTADSVYEQDKHLAPLCGMLSGWSLKHLVDVCQVDGQGADDTDVYFELGVAFLFSMLAIFLIWAVHVINVYARRNSEDLAIFTGRVKTLFTNASGLGTAAAWYAVARSIIKMRDYEAFVNSGDADAAGRDAALFVLRFVFVRRGSDLYVPVLLAAAGYRH